MECPVRGLRKPLEDGRVVERLAGDADPGQERLEFLG
jgi:hypothetical protein